MGLPLFDATSDPGPSFLAFANASGLTLSAGHERDLSPHATTVVALRCDSGVVMVADRQATGGYIASRDVRKIEAADSFTGIAISGSAAMGIEFIRFAQLSFEHYEKMSEMALSLEGKANYLSPLIRYNNFSLGLMVLPMLAGWDQSRRQGRIFEYDGAGGCYERSDFATIGSGTPFAESTLRLGFRSDLTQSEALELAALAIYEAGDNDPSTGGPDFVRNLFPMMVTITEAGFEELPQEFAATTFRTILERRTASGGIAGGTLR
jgi:proteasome beta subunit